MMAFIQIRKCLQTPEHLIKLIVILICVCVTIYQLSGSLMKLLHPPTSTFYKFQLNETIRYPALTICRRPAFKTKYFPSYGLSEHTKFEYDRVFNEFPFANHTIAEFLAKVTYSTTETVPLYAFGGSGQNADVQIRSRQYLKRGLCHTFVPQTNSGIFSEAGGYFLYFRHNTQDKVTDIYGISTTGFDIYLHDPHEILTNEDEQQDSFMEHVYLESAEDMRLSLKLQTYSQISTKDEPCIAESGYSKSKCREICIHRQIAETIGCTLPWLLEEAVIPGLDDCQNSTTVSALISGFNQLNRTRFLRQCHCPISCNISIYNTFIENRKDANGLMAPGSAIIIYFPSNLIIEMNEILGYDWNLFLADIGGSLGFLLGLSVLGVISIIEDLLEMMRSKKAKKPPKNEQLQKDLNNAIEYYEKGPKY